MANFLLRPQLKKQRDSGINFARMVWSYERGGSAHQSAKLLLGRHNSHCYQPHPERSSLTEQVLLMYGLVAGSTFFSFASLQQHHNLNANFWCGYVCDESGRAGGRRISMMWCSRLAVATNVANITSTTTPAAKHHRLRSKLFHEW